jgi:hypothetical protein
LQISALISQPFRFIIEGYKNQNYCQ